MNPENSSSRPKWDAIESNPEVLTNLGRALGMSENYVFEDVFGLDEELLFAQGVEAVILLYPGGGEHRQTGAAAVENNNLFFLEQTEGLGNACGTIAVIHALANATHRGDVLSDAGLLAKFMKGCGGANCAKIGRDLGDDKEMNAIHQRFVQQGQSAAPAEHVNYHFICFVNVKDAKGDVHLYELDGFQPERGRDGQIAVPIDHGTGYNPANLLKDAAKIIKSNYVERNPDEIRFSMMALQKPSED